MHNARLDNGSWPDIRDDLGEALESVAHQEEHIPDATVFEVDQHAHPELGAFSAGAHPQAQYVLVAVHRDADGGVDRPVGDLAIADLDVDGVDEHRHVDRIQRAVGPVVHLRDNFVGDPRDRFPRHRSAVDLREMCRDFPGRQPFRIQRHDDLVNITQATLPFLHNLRFERCVPVARNLNSHLASGIRNHSLRPGTVAHVRRVPARLGPVLLIPEVFGHLLRKRGLQHILGEHLQQTVRAGQRQPSRLGLGHHRRRGGLLRRQLARRLRLVLP